MSPPGYSGSSSSGTGKDTIADRSTGLRLDLGARACTGDIEHGRA
jgi:hypothetical protein